MTTIERPLRELRKISDNGVDPTDASTSNPTETSSAEGEIATTDQVLVVGDELSFGGYDSDDGVATDPGDLVWVRNDVDGIFTPWLSGYFHFNDAPGTRCGIQLSTYDWWNVLLNRRIAQIPVVTSYGHQITDRLGLFGDPTQSGSPYIYRANVSIVVDVSDPLSSDYPDPHWVWVAGRNYYLYETGPAAEIVTIESVDLDFGASTIVDGSPTGGGLLTWNADAGTVSPRLNGFLHAENSQGTTVAMRMKAYDRFDRLVGSAAFDPPGGVYIGDNDYHREDIDLQVAADPSIHYVKLAIVVQDNNGNWDSVKSKRFYL